MKACALQVVKCNSGVCLTAQDSSVSVGTYTVPHSALWALAIVGYLADLTGFSGFVCILFFTIIKAIRIHLKL